MGNLIRNCGMLALAACLVGTTAYAQKDKDKDKGAKTADRMGSAGSDRLSREVRHELVMLPYYGVFDNLAYRVDGRTVTLVGQVTRPTLKKDAENVVKDIEGVERVDNQIEVLPLSSADDAIRLATYRAIYGRVGLDRYALQAVPPIHIIVSNGKVSLEGVVASEADKNQAGLYANGVSGVFSVTNNLRAENH
ncbi:MAG: BON domain-containing protein [Candidatus Solibacter sp.]